MLVTVDVISFTHWYFTISLSNKKRYQVTVTRQLSVPQSYVQFFFGKGGDSLEVLVTCGYCVSLRYIFSFPQW